MPKEIPCQVCGNILTKKDLEAGAAVVVDHKVYCAEHDPRMEFGDNAEPVSSGGGSGKALLAIFAVVILGLAGTVIFLLSSDEEPSQPDEASETVEKLPQQPDTPPEPGPPEPEETETTPELDEPGPPEPDTPDETPAAAEITKELEKQLTLVNEMIGKGKMVDAQTALKALKGTYKGAADRKALKEMEARLKEVASDNFDTYLAEAKKYMAQGQMKTAIELLEEIKNVVIFPEQEAKRKAMLAAIQAGGTDPDSMAAQALFYKAEAQLKQGNKDQAYTILQELLSKYIKTEFYASKKAVIGAHMSAIKRDKLMGGTSKLVYFHDFDGDSSDWESGELTKTAVLESGAIQLKLQLENKWYSSTAVVKDNKGVFTCPGDAEAGVLLFRYYTDIPVPINIRLANKTQNDNFDYKINEPVPGRWVWAQAPLKNFEDADHAKKKFAKDDLIQRIQISAGPPGVKISFLLDEIAVCFDGIPRLYQTALNEDSKLLAGYTKDPDKDFVFFSSSVIRTVLTLNRANVKPKTILIFGDRLIKGIDLGKVGFARTDGYQQTARPFSARKGYEDLVPEFTKALNSLPAPPEIAIIGAGFDELIGFSSVLYAEKRAAAKGKKFGLETQNGGFEGWWIWADKKGEYTIAEARGDNSATSYNDAKNRDLPRFQVPTDGKNWEGKPTGCNCPEYDSKQSCDHVKYIADMVRRDERKQQYAKDVQAAYEAIIKACLQKGTIPILISPALVPDKFQVIAEWNFDYKNSVFRAADAHKVPYVSLFALVTQAKVGKKMRGGSGGLSTAGAKAMNAKLGELYKLLEKFCFRPE